MPYDVKENLVDIIGNANNVIMGVYSLEKLWYYLNMVKQTTTMELEAYLLHHSLEDLYREHGVKYRLAGEGRKVSLNYIQLEAKDGDPIAEECRGTILAKADYSVINPDTVFGSVHFLGRPFKRFYNMGQGAAADVDFEDPGTRFFEKMDGTMCILYFDDHKYEWHVATRSVAEADLFIDGFEEYTFRTLFERAVKDTTGRTFKEFTGLLSYMPVMSLIFELTTPVNRIVVPYETYGITLLGARNRGGREFDPVPLAEELGVPSPEIFKLDSLADMVDFVSSRNPKDYEGIVACDTEYRRVKIKNANYIALSKVRDSVGNSPRAMLTLILSEKDDDVVGMLPDHLADAMIEMKSGVQALFQNLDEEYESYYNSDRKTFVLSVQGAGLWLTPLIDRWQGKCTDTNDWLLKKRIQTGGWSNLVLDRILNMI